MQQSSVGRGRGGAGVSVVVVVVPVVTPPEVAGEVEAARLIRIVDEVCRSDALLKTSGSLLLVLAFNVASGFVTTRVSSSIGSVCISNAPGGSMDSGIGRL